MATQILRYPASGHEVELGVEETGTGASVVLLPALSSISTRAEMRPLAERLAAGYRVRCADWAGFGELPRPRLDWSPQILSDFLHWLLAEHLTPPHRVVAAGHAATYALYEAVHHPGTIERLALVAPTWRGPLPTMMGGPRAWFKRIRTLIDAPVMGPLLYRLNVSRIVVAMMAREHVYGDPAWLNHEREAAKIAITRARGARHASVRFVSGALDRVDSREAFLGLARRAGVPLLVVYGEQTPRKSLAEIQALTELAAVRTERLPRGRLSIHEEFPDAVARVVLPFFAQ